MATQIVETEQNQLRFCILIMTHHNYFFKIMDIQGYCTISRTATTGVGQNLETFIGQDCRVIDFNERGDVLLINREATHMAMFDKVDVYRFFQCKMYGDVVCPPDMGLPEQIAYSAKVLTRKGGYNTLLKHMVIEASLMKGCFTDRFLFSK